MNIKEYRKKHRIRQSDFWQRVGITQSGGSRYEGARAIPEPVQLLLAIAYGSRSERNQALAQLGKRGNGGGR